MLRLGLSSSKSDHERHVTDSHTNFRYLDTPEKFETMRNLHKLVHSQQKKIAQLQQTLDRYIQTDGVKVDDTTNKDLYTIMTRNSNSILSLHPFSLCFNLFHLQKKQCHSTPIKTYLEGLPAFCFFNTWLFKGC